ncbi:protein translocase subunit SecE [Polynucleobacter sp. TUM22923]|jgi:preprotein translocase subunit SecE|uniref:preprotein translocase subunit SecE n=1 Tax=Polynucleobacter sp. TUM22923 TaxID=3022126 RepID=UPI0025730BC8|nr:preprotein translocase subunit SecE [Polynucleobacter sp. TUM22923]BDX20715.1 protein translocase subunit SecE [Polynucleobacter sp. TUM22923]
MSQQTVGNSEEKSSWVSGLAALIVVAALVLYYTLADQSLLIRLLVLFGGIAFAVFIVAISPDGRRFVAYAKDSWYEVKKVVWPTRKETTQMTLVVFGFVLVMSIFLWVADKLIEWLVFSVFLGWK